VIFSVTISRSRLRAFSSYAHICTTHSLSLSLATSISPTNILSLSLSHTNTRTHKHTHKHSHTQSHTHTHTHIHTHTHTHTYTHTYTSIIRLQHSTQRHMIESVVDRRLQGAEDAYNALRCTSLSPKTPRNIGLFG